MIMALPKIISILAPKIFKVIKNLRSKEGGEGSFNMKLLGKDIAVDIVKVALIVIVLLALFGVISFEDAEKAKDLIQD